jgi:hypothetical protein
MFQDLKFGVRMLLKGPGSPWWPRSRCPLAQETLQALSRHRTGARVALQQRPILLRDRSIVCKRRGGNQPEREPYLSSSICTAISIGAV